MTKNYATLLFITFLLTGCLSQDKKDDISSSGPLISNSNINYYSSKSVTSLEVPPDLTKPNYQNSFRLSEFVSGYDESIVNFTNKDIQVEKKKSFLTGFDDIQVEKFGNRRWLLIDKNPDLVWSMANSFFKENGFSIKTSNRDIGILETDYLENKPNIPSKSMGWIRSMLQSTIDNVNYTMPSVDKYTLRVESLDNGTRSEVHLTVSSMAEVAVGGERTLWQAQERDIALENKMLFTFMLYLGSAETEAREKIINAKETNKLQIELGDGINGYAKLIVNQNIEKSWDTILWYITKEGVEIEDKDIKEKAIYLKLARNSDKGIMTTIFGEDAVYKTYQIYFKKIKPNLTEVYFNDISEVNEKETKVFSYEFFKKIKAALN